ncbi:TolC family protein [Emticicia agri]|uniref:TolC family protein n=1 Tax=Emticicia agri TaxID=2492393 RepID=A0A4Q5M122_9BACT|nr:TolC family protein [Emticicia agri]RYU95543.1 TolC family protein [Emticicia agri]
MKTYQLEYHRLIAILFLFLSKGVWAQTLTLQQSIELASKNNYLLKISSLETESEQLLIKTTKELAKTNLDIQLGRTQAAYTNDYTLGLVQQFSHPKLYQAQADLQKSRVVASQRNEVLQKNELTGNIKQVYYQLFYYQQLREILSQQDSIYRSTLQIALARHKTGETNSLEKISAEIRLQEINNRLSVLAKDEESAYQHFKLLLNNSQDFKLDFNIPLRRDTSAITNTLSLTNNPLLSVFEQQTIISQQQIHVEKQKLKPDFRLGIINQSIEHNFNQMVLSAGIGLPIFTQAQKARVEVAKVNERIADSNRKQIELRLNTQLNMLKMAYQKHRNSLRYYENFALPQADLMMKNAIKSYQSGEIEYVELIQINQQVWQLKDSYFSTVLDFNQTIIQIETLLGIE